MAKKKKTAKKAGGGKSAPELVVKSKAKEALKAHDVNVAGDAIDGLNAVVAWYIDQAATRAKANGRKTVRPHDFIAM